MSNNEESHWGEPDCEDEYGSDYPTIHEELADRGISIQDFI
ncbi:hypothetical protein [Paenibacillus sp. W2I17]|nr:hypothetical protein [Paenibacillus sp. W2I17]MDQ0658798.1 hypothetical protein [Paenibacillus sp. W2I17]